MTIGGFPSFVEDMKVIQPFFVVFIIILNFFKDLKVSFDRENSLSIYFFTNHVKFA